MMRSVIVRVVPSLAVAAFLAGTLAAEPPQSKADDAGAATAEKETGPVKPAGPVAGADQPSGEDFLAEALKMNSSKHPLPEPDFQVGHVQNLKFDRKAIQKTENGFTIQMPSGTAVATPAIRNGRLYVSGGFSCTEFYCFDAKTGKFVWGKELDDDGASAPLVYDDSIIFNTESCTIFVLDAADGKLRWAHWLGDPLMSVPCAAAGRVFTTYPASDAAASGEFGEFADPSDTTGPKAETTVPEKGEGPAEKGSKTVVPTHILIAFDAKTGKVLWRRWIDTECMSAPVADGDCLYLTTLSGTLYKFKLDDGKLLAARRLRATSAPIITERYLYCTRRTDPGKEGRKVSEAIVRIDRTSGLENYLTCSRPAPYLDWRVQIEARSTLQAHEMEKVNAIGGGFGGGFYSVPPEMPAQAEPNQPAELPRGESQDVVSQPQGGPGASAVFVMDEPPQDLLAVTERVAADVIGQGNVSMLQSYHGSRVLPLGDRNVACMGDLVVCVAAESGELLWSVPLEGDLEGEGGYLASPPVLAGSQVFLSTLAGEVLQLDPQTGKKVESYRIGSPLRYPPLVVAGRIYATTQDGKVVCVDTGNPQLTGWQEWCHDSANTNVAPQRFETDEAATPKEPFEAP